MKIDAIQLNPIIGDLEGNTKKILEALSKSHADVVLFSELVITGYPPQDLLLDETLITAAEESLQRIMPATMGRFVVVGVPRQNPNHKEKPLYNSAAIFIDGQLVGFKDKSLLPTYDVFDERRFFEPGVEQPVFTFQGKRIGVLICEDCWQNAGEVGYSNYVRNPVLELREQKIDLLLNLSASPYYYKRSDTRLSVFSACAKTLGCPVIVCNQVGANDQIVFDGHSLHINPQGDLVQIAKGFVEDVLRVDLSLNYPQINHSTSIPDLYAALVLGVRDYFQKQGFSKAILGLSGGIDSALVACIAKDALGAEQVLALTLPSRYSSEGSYLDSELLAEKLGIKLEKLSIDLLFQAYLDQLSPYFEPSDLTSQNLQARVRGMLLMAFSNQTGALLLNTSNKSEMAMGYSTLYGDMTGGLGVLQDVSKHFVYQLAKFVNRIPASIIDKIPSAELKPNQTDFDSLPKYEILDPILEAYLEEGLSAQTIANQCNQPLDFVQDIIQKIHAAEYKRRQAPIGIRVTQKAFSKGRNIPIVQRWKWPK
jgi:NAD+ synthase (glutamine-hydrolysing)